MRSQSVRREGLLLQDRDRAMLGYAIVRHFDHAVIVPGFLDLATGLGLGGPLTTPVSLDTKLGDRLVSGDPAVAVARQGGVTTVLLASAGSAASPVVAFKLGDRPRVLQDPVAIRFGLTGNLTSQAASLRSTLERAKSYADEWTRYETARVEYDKQKQEYDKRKKEYDAAKAKSDLAQRVFRREFLFTAELVP